MASVVFTNGCFDILHPGHVDLLKRAKELGDKLIVGINSDHSVQTIKGPGRPFFNQQDRSAVLLGLNSVDEVIVFDELTPENLIRKIRPDVLVKGGDWKTHEIVGADFVESYGGKVYSLPLVDGHSSSKVVDLIRSSENQSIDISKRDATINGLSEHLKVFERLLGSHLSAIDTCARILADTFESGNKVLICGNGGSAADAQHIAAEFVGRYERERKALPAIALTTDTSALTALANDFGFENVFSRQIEAHAKVNDCLLAISTSGTSPNIISALMTARKAHCKVIGLTGSEGKKLAALCDAVVMVPSERTARIQEAHIAIAHYWCETLQL